MHGAIFTPLSTLGFKEFRYDTELKSTAESSDKENTYVPSDENFVVVAERFRYAEMLLLPSVIGKETYRIDDTSFQNVMKYDVDIRVHLYANVVLSSSTTMYQEIGECMTKETDGIMVYSHVLLCLQFFFFGTLSEPLYIFPCHCRAARPCQHCTVLKCLMSSPKKKERDER